MNCMNTVRVLIWLYWKLNLYCGVSSQCIVSITWEVLESAVLTRGDAPSRDPTCGVALVDLGPFWGMSFAFKHFWSV